MGLTSGSARGDIPPIVTGEYVFVILMEVVGTVALGLILGSLSSMFMVSALLLCRESRCTSAASLTCEYSLLWW